MMAVEEDEAGNPIYEPVRKLDLAAKNKADDGLAKMHGFNIDVTRIEDLDAELDGKTPEELQQFTLALLEQLDPNMRKKLLEQMQPAAEEEAPAATEPQPGEVPTLQ